MRKLYLVPALAVLLVLAWAAPAFAQSTSAPDLGDLAVPLSWAAVIAVAIMSIVIPYINAYVTSPNAPAWVTGPLSAVLAAAGAFVAYLVDIKGVPDWKHAVTLAVAAAVGSAGFRTTIEPGIEPVLKDTKGGLSPAPAGTAAPSTVSGPGSSGTAPSVK